ncbi:hypothetical protein VTN02DRAFT_325 [Thermoascus thermophilus]
MDGSGGPTLPCQIPANGLTVLVDPDEPSLDIVFVHGFTGHPERTWTHKRGGAAHGYEYDDEGVERPTKLRRLGLHLKSSQEKHTAHKAVYWPRDLVPLTVPNARVLTFGYDTRIRHCFGPPVSGNTVYDIAWDFLVALEAERRQDASRPVLFIAHSLGGDHRQGDATTVKWLSSWSKLSPQGIRVDNWHHLLWHPAWWRRPSRVSAAYRSKGDGNSRVESQ